MPRYHVKDTQESGDSKSQSSTGSKSSTDISSSNSSGSHGACDGSTTSGGSSNSVTGFRPLYLPNSTQACHCSACVGAVAANVHPVREREREREGEREGERDSLSHQTYKFFVLGDFFFVRHVIANHVGTLLV